MCFWKELKVAIFVPVFSFWDCLHVSAPDFIDREHINAQTKLIVMLQHADRSTTANTEALQ